MRALLCCLLVGLSAQADIVVTIGDVSGVNTSLSVTVVGQGFLGEDLETQTTANVPVYTDFSGGVVDPSPDPVALVGDSVPFLAENDIGDYLSGNYVVMFGDRLQTEIPVDNLTDGTSGGIRWLGFDEDSPGLDDFTLFVDSTDASLFDSGDHWYAYGTSTLELQGLGGAANASHFNTGIYNYLDPALGLFTLVIQPSPAILPPRPKVVPEPGTVLIFAGIFLLGIVGLRRRSRQS